MDARKLKYFVNVIISPLALVVNGFYLHLIYSKSSTALRAYKKVLYLGATVDVLYSLISLFFAPTTFICDDIYFVILEGILGPLQETMTVVGFLLNAFVTYLCIATTQVQFVYRYLLICRNKQLGNAAFLGLISTGVFLCGLYGFAGYLGIGILTTSDDLVHYQSLVNFTGWSEVSEGKGNYGATRIVSYFSICNLKTVIW